MKRLKCGPYWIINSDDDDDINETNRGFWKSGRGGSLNQVQIREMQELVRLQRLKVEGQIM